MKSKTMKLFVIVCPIALIFSAMAGCKKEEETKESEGKSTTAAVKTSAKVTTTAKTGTGLPSTTAKDSTSGEDTDNSDEYAPVDENGDVQDEGDDEYDEYDGELPEERNFDFGGRLVQIAHEVALPGEWVVNPDNPISVMEFESVADVEAKYNCKLNVLRLTTKQFNEGISNALLAGLKFADVIRRWTYNAMPGYVNQGIIIPIDEYVDGRGYEERYQRMNWNAKANFWNGRRYGIIPLESQNRGTALVFNTTILDNEGLEYPYRYHWEGTWTWERMVEYALRTTKDFNGDGINDQWGIMGNPAYSLFYSNGGNVVTFDDAYNPNYGFDIVANVRAMNFVIELINTYKVVDLTSGVKFQNGQHAMMFSGANQFSLLLAGFLDFGIVAVPKGPDVDRYISAVETEAAFYFTNMVDEQDLENVIQIVVDYMSVDDYEPYVIPWEEQVQQKMQLMVGEDNFESQEIARQLMQLEESVYTKYFSPLQGRINAVIINPVSTMQVPLMTAVESFKPEAMSIIQGYYN